MQAGGARARVSAGRRTEVQWRGPPPAPADRGNGCNQWLAWPAVMGSAPRQAATSRTSGLLGTEPIRCQSELFRLAVFELPGGDRRSSRVKNMGNARRGALGALALIVLAGGASGALVDARVWAQAAPEGRAGGVEPQSVRARIEIAS